MNFKRFDQITGSLTDSLNTKCIFREAVKLLGVWQIPWTQKAWSGNLSNLKHQFPGIRPNSWKIQGFGKLPDWNRDLANSLKFSGVWPNSWFGTFTVTYPHPVFFFTTTPHRHTYKQFTKLILAYSILTKYITRKWCSKRGKDFSVFSIF